MDVVVLVDDAGEKQQMEGNAYKNDVISKTCEDSRGKLRIGLGGRRDSHKPAIFRQKTEEEAKCRPQQ